VLELNPFKNYAKQNGCTLNDYATSLVGTALHEYFTKYKSIDNVEYPVPESIAYLMPFSLR